MAILSISGWLVACQAVVSSFTCSDPLGCVNIAPGEPIKIGMLQPLSGDVAPIGVDQVRSIELALADRNSQIFGHPVEFQKEDDLCSAEGGKVAAQKIVADPQIVAILGTYCSGAAVPAAKIMSQAGLVMVSGGNTAPSLTSVGGKQGSNWQPGYFRTAYNDEIQGQTAATFAFQKLGVTQVATINDGDPYTQGLTGVFNHVFAELGGENVLDATINKGETDMRPVLTAVAASQAQLVFFPIFEPEGDLIVLQATEVAELDGIILMSADGLLTNTFIQAVGDHGLGMYFAGPATPHGPAYDAFIAKYKATYGEPPLAAFHAHAYDAANLVFNAIEAVAMPDKDGTLHIGRQALRDALYAITDYQGLTGRLTCNQFGDCGAARFNVMRLDQPAAGLEGLMANIVYTHAQAQ
ncbi:MAG: branched-chain amino acid ABC transporter substrate-binding protein [Chloroflexota bacterium]